MPIGLKKKKKNPYFAIKKPTKTGLKLRDYNMTIRYEGALT